MMACSCPNKIQIVGNTFVGDAVGNPFTELELYEVSKLGDWDCVNTNDGVNYNVGTNIEVGNGADMTVLIITGKNIIFDAGKDFIPNPPCYIKVGSVWTQAEKEVLFSQIADIHDEALGKWELDHVAKTLTYYRLDGSVLVAFSLPETTAEIPTFIGRIPT